MSQHRFEHTIEHQTILDVVEEQTTGDLPPVISQFDLHGRAASAGVDKTIAADLIDNLVTTNYLLRWERDGDRWLCRNESEAIRRALVYEANRQDPDRGVVAELNGRLQEHRI